MACFAHNDIGIILSYFFWQPVYYLLDSTEKSYPGKSKEMRAGRASVDEGIGAKMCWKFIDDNIGKIICRSVIRSALEPGTANLQVDPIEPLQDDAILDTEDDAMLNGFMSLVDFETPFSRKQAKGAVNSIPASTKSKT